MKNLLNDSDLRPFEKYIFYQISLAKRKAKTVMAFPEIRLSKHVNIAARLVYNIA